MKEIYFTNEQMKALKPMEGYFHSIKVASYKRNTTIAENTLVADIFDQATGGKWGRNFSCGACVYNLFKQAGEIYYRTKNQIGAELIDTLLEIADEEEEQEQQEKTVTNNGNKVRKPKNTKGKQKKS